MAVSELGQPPLTVVRKNICRVLRNDDLKSGAFVVRPNPTPDSVVGEVTFGIHQQFGRCPITVISGHPPPG